jgi:hypothetical protein
MAEDSEEAGPVHVRLLTTLKDIQSGKIPAPDGWCVEVTEVDIKKSSPIEATNGIRGIEDALH